MNWPGVFCFLEKLSVEHPLGSPVQGELARRNAVTEGLSIAAQLS